MTWNIVLQLDGRRNSNVANSCTRTTLAGLPAPARIAILSLDQSSDTQATRLEQEIGRRIGVGSQAGNCGGARLSGCMAESEPACTHVLVLVISPTACPIDPTIEGLARDWLRMAPGRARVVPMLLPPATYRAAVPNSHANPVLSRLGFTIWTTVRQIAGYVLEAALVGERPTAFISYVRKEASATADALHDELGRHGYRIFLDRFSGTPGRAFPQEIAEEMAEMGVVIALETPNLLRAKWTKWEIALARLNGSGILALNFQTSNSQASPRIPGVFRRHSIGGLASTGLTGAPLAGAVDFITRNRPLASLRPRAMFQAIVSTAARNGKGAARSTLNGAQIVSNLAGADKAVVLASGRPGRLRDIRLLDLALQPPATRAILAGQHEHLPAAARADIDWVAKLKSVELCGRSDVYRRVRQIARTP